MYRVRCFGTPELHLDDAPVALARKKSMALLVYLAVTAQPHTRESLAALLWPDHDEPHAFGYLRTALYELNAAGSGGLLVTDRQSVRIAPSVVDVDVVRFRSLCAAPSADDGHARLAEAVDLRRESFLKGFTLKDAPGFDDWQRQTAEELDGGCRVALESLVRLCVKDDDLPAAVARARQLLALDELDERHHRLLMRVLSLAGQHAAAEAHYEQCRRVLERELAAEPSEQTRRLHHYLRTGRNATDDGSFVRELREDVLGHTGGPAAESGRPAAAPPVRQRPGALPAALNEPTGVFVDRHGRIVVADSGNHRVVRMDDLDGRGAVALGSRGTGRGQFLAPWGVWEDPLGRIYVTDAQANRIVRFDDMTGAGWTSFGSKGSGVGGFSLPRGVCVDPLGRVLVADSGNHRLVRMDDMDGAGWSSLGGPAAGTGPGTFFAPSDVFVDGSGWIYVSNAGSNSIVRIDDMEGTGWSVVRAAGRIRYAQKPLGVSVDPRQGDLLVSFGAGRSIVRIAGMTGLYWTELHGRPGGNPSLRDRFHYPHGLHIDGKGRIYVADAANHRIVRVDDISGAGWIEYPPRSTEGT